MNIPTSRLLFYGLLLSPGVYAFSMLAGLIVSYWVVQPSEPGHRGGYAMLIYMIALPGIIGSVLGGCFFVCLRLARSKILLSSKRLVVFNTVTIATLCLAPFLGGFLFGFTSLPLNLFVTTVYALALSFILFVFEKAFEGTSNLTITDSNHN